MSDYPGRPITAHPRVAAAVPWLFLAPAVVFLGVFKLWPTVRGVWFSFEDVRPYLGNRWVGLANFRKLFTDGALGTATWHTLLDAAVTVGVGMLVGFGLALLLEGPARHLRILRTVAFLPVVTAMVVVAEIWNTLMYPGGYGPLNSILAGLGVGPLGFLSDPDQSLASLMVIQIWRNAPYDMVIFVAGLAGIDRQLYEAAHIDGANVWQRLRNVTLPALRPITTIVLILGLIRGLRVFTEVYVLTGGGPGSATEVLGTEIYKTGIVSNNLGYASAISTVLLLGTVVLTCATLWWRRHRENA